MSVKVITKDNFENEVMHSEKPVLLDFWAAWCGPCKMLSPLVDKYSEEDSSVKVGKVNVDEEMSLQPLSVSRAYLAFCCETWQGSCFNCRLYA